MIKKLRNLAISALCITFLAIPAHTSPLDIIPLNEADAGMFLDLNELRLLGGVSVPVISFKGLIDAEIGTLFDSEDVIPLIALSGNVKNIVEGPLAKMGLVYKLPGEIVLGSFLAYDLEHENTLLGFKLAYRFK